MTAGATSQNQTADQQALAWVARLRSDTVGEVDRANFALWLAESADHRRAMDDALELWDDLGVVRHLPEAAFDRPAANQSRWLAAGALAATLLLALVLWPMLDPAPRSELLQTAYSEQRLVELEDGSRVLLNANSRLSVAYSDHQRLLTLLRGEAFFEVAHNPRRPFHVDTGSARVTAVGTAFNVRLERESAAITVTEGVVRVSELAAVGSRVPAQELLRAAQGMVATPAGLQDAAVVNAQAVLAWRRGELVAESMPLPRLLDELQRYHGLDVLVTDPDVAAMSVSGVFQLDEPEAILRALELTHGLQMSRLADGSIRLLPSRQ